MTGRVGAVVGDATYVHVYDMCALRPSDTPTGGVTSGLLERRVFWGGGK